MSCYLQVKGINVRMHIKINNSFYKKKLVLFYILNSLLEKVNNGMLELLCKTCNIRKKLKI